MIKHSYKEVVKTRECFSEMAGQNFNKLEVKVVKPSLPDKFVLEF